MVKFNGVPFERTLLGLMNEFRTETEPTFKKSGNNINSNRYTPVNITEKEKSYEIDVVAPGFEKADFKINLEENLLTISAEAKAEENAENGDKNIRKEFIFRSIKRSFTIDEKVDAEKISAQYVNGILKVTLEKKEITKPTSKNIEIQ